MSLCLETCLHVLRFRVHPEVPQRHGRFWYASAARGYPLRWPPRCTFLLLPSGAYTRATSFAFSKTNDFEKAANRESAGPGLMRASWILTNSSRLNAASLRRWNGSSWSNGRRLNFRQPGNKVGSASVTRHDRLKAPFRAKLLSQGTPPKIVATSLGVSVPTLYRWVPATDTAAAAIPLLHCWWRRSRAGELRPGCG